MVRRYKSRTGSYRASVSRRGFSASRGKIGVNFSPGFLVGALAGLTSLSAKLPKPLVLAAAVAPVSGIGIVKGAAQGVVVGDLLKNYVGLNVPVPSAVSTAFGGF